MFIETLLCPRCEHDTIHPIRVCVGFRNSEGSDGTVTDVSCANSGTPTVNFVKAEKTQKSIKQIDSSSFLGEGDHVAIQFDCVGCDKTSFMVFIENPDLGTETFWFTRNSD